MRDRRLVTPAAVLLGALVGSAGAEVTVRDPGTFVVDQAGIVDTGQRQRLEGWLRELEQKTTAQVKVLTVPTTEGEDIFGFTQRHFDLWRLGRAGKDNGALITVAVNDRHVRIHTGYGLEGALPDSWCGSLSRDIAAEYFKQGAYSEGVYRLAVATANKVADEANVQLTGIPEYRYRGPRGGVLGTGGVCVGGGFAPFIVLLIIFSSMSRRGRNYRHWGGGGLWQGMLLGSMLGSMSRGGRSHWGGGFGGGLGGGFGGFGGGFGGGSFGGGGFSGGGGGGASW